MEKRKTKRVVLNSFVTVVLLVAPGLAKRMPPRSVAPVVANGIEYSADGNGRDGYVIASDARNNRELWRVKVFHNRIKFWIEEDVQWVYITNLKLSGSDIWIRDEAARCYTVNIMNKKVNKQSCGTAFSSAGTGN
jgi:hypothetical protein